jgi:hypothetical protein
MRKPLALLAALLLTTSLAAGCGDEGDDGANDDASTSVEGGDGATDDTDDSDESTTTTDGESPDDTADASDTTLGAGSDPDSEFCEAARAFASDPEIADLDFTQPEDIQHGVDLLTGLRDAAPAELQDDLDIVIEGFQAVATALGEAGQDPAAQQEAIAGLEGEFQTISEASTNVQTFTQEQCGIDVAGTGAGTETPTG